MTVTFFSNFLLHHQLPFCNNMYKALSDDFKFVATSKIPQERLDLGYKDLSHDYPYSLNSYDNEESLKEAKRLANDSDIVIIGAAPKSLFVDRLNQDKLTFRYTERLFKNGKWRIFDPRVAKSLYSQHTKYRNNTNFYLLCASAYTAPDCKFIHSYKDKMLKWGYFPPLKNRNQDDALLKKSDEQIKLLWAGRFIDWKRPKQPIQCLKYLLDKGYTNLSLDMIGGGELEGELKSLAEKLQVSDRVNFTGAMSPEKVLDYMESANVFIFSSNKEEGWGAVLNESMSSGCAVIASREIGSVPFLIEDGKNGIVYNGKIDDLCQKAEWLVKDNSARNTLSQNAVKTVYNEWHPDVATERLLNLSQNLLSGKFEPYQSGPCSPAL